MKNPSFRGSCMMGLLVRRRRPDGAHKAPSPAGSADRGLGYDLFQALVGAALPDDDDYDASPLHSLTSHVAHATTRDSEPTRGSRQARTKLHLPGHCSRCGSWSIIRVVLPTGWPLSCGPA